MQQILQEYDDKESLFADFKSKIESLVFNLLKTKEINFHHITSRKKDKDSLSRKLNKKQGYTCLGDITDVVGCRIITYFEDDVDKIAEIIEKEFKIDTENSVDKRRIEFDRFGYQSLHYVVSLRNDRLRLTEYKPFKGLKAEIQIRSILQHSWAEIEHDIGYKGKYSIPDIVKRRFSRISALLETADIEFVALRNELSTYEKNIKKEIIENPSDVTLNKASFEFFISSDSNLKTVDLKVATHIGVRVASRDAPIENMLSLLEFAGLKSIQDLQNYYKEKSQCIVEFAKLWRTNKVAPNEGGIAIYGISIYDLAFWEISKKKSKQELITFLISSSTYKGEISETVSRIYNAIQKIDKNCR